MIRRSVVLDVLALPLLMLAAQGCSGGASCTDDGTCAAMGGGDAGAKGADASGGAPLDASHDAPTSADSGASGCVVGGTPYAPGAVDPANECESCQPDVNASGWSNLANGAACGDAGVCFGGSCSTGCYIGGSYYGEDVASPDNSCQTCQAATSTTTWNYVSDGTSCGCTQDSQCPQGDFCWVSACRKATALTVGTLHACALTTGGAVQCWGDNSDGELGNGSMSPAVSDVPTAVSDLASGATAVSAGYFHTCALTTGGAVQCWGDNSDGELGNGSMSPTVSDVPTAVSGLSSGVRAVAAGENFTCALTAAQVVCWGDNESGQLGNAGYGSDTCSDGKAQCCALPSGTQVALNEATAIATGGAHACALLASGTVQCWGGNDEGQLGNDSTTESDAPVAVSNLSGVAAIAAGIDFTCALTTAGAVQCWGYNGEGELGDGSTTQSDVPVAVSNLSGVTAIATGYDHACALTTAGTVQCWGGNEGGQLGIGNGSTVPSDVPVAVSNLSGVTAIAAGGYYTCALTSAGAVQCWGYNGQGQLGNGFTTQSDTRTAVVEP